MGYSFDGVAKIISLTVGTTAMDVKDFYSRWKDWTQTGGSKYLQAMSIVGGDPIDQANGIYVTSYIFLENGWKVRPYEGNHKLKVSNGVLLTSTGDDPFLQTVGSYNVLVQYSQPVRSESTVIETGVSGLTAEESETLLLLKQYVTNKKYLIKEGLVWYLIIRNSTNTANIIKKALKDKNGDNISDVAAGVLAQEIENIA